MSRSLRRRLDKRLSASGLLGSGQEALEGLLLCEEEEGEVEEGEEEETTSILLADKAFSRRPMSASHASSESMMALSVSSKSQRRRGKPTIGRSMRWGRFIASRVEFRTARPPRRPKKR